LWQEAAEEAGEVSGQEGVMLTVGPIFSAPRLILARFFIFKKW
jgi:hypothetical protein